MARTAPSCRSVPKFSHRDPLLLSASCPACRSVQEREQEYHRARARIFGGDASAGGTSPSEQQPSRGGSRQANGNGRGGGGQLGNKKAVLRCELNTPKAARLSKCPYPHRSVIPRISAAVWFP